ncbi:MAG: peptidylprolyl isomerase [Gammaproteobacteria bacterium]|nr:peptidylprolyl isomerase [Gammaproteobacteria bacterium]
MTIKNKHQILAILTILIFFMTTSLRAGTASAKKAMQNGSNPLIVMHTEFGSIYIELFPDEAPRNVKYFLQLIRGEISSKSAPDFSPRYLDNRLFENSIPSILVQGGDSRSHPFGAPTAQPEIDISAKALGLDKTPLINAEGLLHPNLAITSKDDYEEKLLKPFLKKNNIMSTDMIKENQFILFESLRNLTLEDGLKLQGLTFTDSLDSRMISRGTLVLSEPGGPGFLLTLKSLPHLNGRLTVIGKIVEGITFADEISQRIGESKTPVSLYSTRVIQ